MGRLMETCIACHLEVSQRLLSVPEDTLYDLAPMPKGLIDDGPSLRVQAKAVQFEQTKKSIGNLQSKGPCFRHAEPANVVGGVRPALLTRNWFTL